MQYRQDDEREINLLDIMWEFLIQWKPAVLFSLIVAVLASTLLYMKDIKKYKVDLEEYQSAITISENNIDDATEEARKGLTEGEHLQVENTIFNLRTLKGYEERLKAISLIDMEGDRFHNIVFRYSGQIDEMTYPVLEGAYRDEVSNKELLETLKEIDPNYSDAARVLGLIGMGAATSASYRTKEIIDPDDNEDDILDYTFNVSVLLLKETDVQEVEKAVKAYMDKAVEDVNKKIPNEGLNFISATETTYIDTGAGTNFLKVRTDAQNLRATIARDIAAFTDDQIKLYNTLLIKAGYTDDVVEETGDEEDTGKDSDQESIKVDSTDSLLVEEPEKPKQISPKYIFIGLFGGLFLYGMIIVCIYIFTGRVHALDEVCEPYGIRGIDEIHERRFDTAWRRFMYSRRIYDLRFAKTRISMEEHLSSAVRYMSEYALHKGLKHITIIPAYADASENGLCGRYIMGLKNIWNKDMIPMEISKHWTTEYTNAAPGEKEGIVILMHANDTVFTTLDHIAGYCQDYSVTVIGTVLLEG